jgi:hypothetical protein
MGRFHRINQGWNERRREGMQPPLNIGLWRLDLGTANSFSCKARPAARLYSYFLADSRFRHDKLPEKVDVKVSRLIDGHLIVEEGLSLDDWVVVSGGFAVPAGQQVEPRQSTEPQK